MVWSSGASDVTVQERDLIGHYLFEVRVQIGLEVRAVIGQHLTPGDAGHDRLRLRIRAADASPVTPQYMRRTPLACLVDS